jgi:hypothetical protein
VRLPHVSGLRAPSGLGQDVSMGGAATLRTWSGPRRAGSAPWPGSSRHASSRWTGSRTRRSGLNSPIASIIDTSRSADRSPRSAAVEISRVRNLRQQAELAWARPGSRKRRAALTSSSAASPELRSSKKCHRYSRSSVWAARRSGPPVGSAPHPQPRPGVRRTLERRARSTQVRERSTQVRERPVRDRGRQPQLRAGDGGRLGLESRP